MWENQGKSGQIKENLKFIQGKRWPGVGKCDRLAGRIKGHTLQGTRNCILLHAVSQVVNSCDATGQENGAQFSLGGALIGDQTTNS